MELWDFYMHRAFCAFTSCYSIQMVDPRLVFFLLRNNLFLVGFPGGFFLLGNYAFF